jgi:hypothetical protein
MTNPKMGRKKHFAGLWSRAESESGWEKLESERIDSSQFYRFSFASLSFPSLSPKLGAGVCWVEMYV